MSDQQSSRIQNPSRPYQPKLILHYHHERRLCRYKVDIHQLWSRTFTGTQLPPTKLIVGHRNHPNLKRELVRTKPTLLLRQKPPPKTSIAIVHSTHPPCLRDRRKQTDHNVLPYKSTDQHSNKASNPINFHKNPHHFLLLPSQLYTCSSSLNNLTLFFQ